MAKIFITLTGTKHYFGNDFLEKGMKIRLEKEPDNEYDKEAIKVTYEGLGKIGYVAISCLFEKIYPHYFMCYSFRSYYYSYWNSVRKIRVMDRWILGFKKFYAYIVDDCDCDRNY